MKTRLVHRAALLAVVIIGLAGMTAVVSANVADAQPLGSFSMSVSSGPVGTLVHMSGNAGTGCPSGQANQPNIVFRKSGESTPLEILYMPVTSSGAWGAEFVIPSYLPIYNSGGRGACQARCLSVLGPTLPFRLHFRALHRHFRFCCLAQQLRRHRVELRWPRLLAGTGKWRRPQLRRCAVPWFTSTGSRGPRHRAGCTDYRHGVHT